MSLDTIVVDGKDAARHEVFGVYRRMLLQIVREFPALPDPRTLTIGEIRFFYNDLRIELRERTKRQPKKPK